ncbi:citrate/2-methylcitrate synthase [Piscibacillus salipiscarius]|uniref:citrate/2-methylcitrate synthase n=1 Tax=Piscibacillus salipiscarius TaxID=299480 RepID=UPI000ACB225A
MANPKGLEGIVATESSISSIIDDKLTYVGYDIDDLAENSSFEEIIYLLWNQKLPTQNELDSFKKRTCQQHESSSRSD